RDVFRKRGRALEPRRRWIDHADGAVADLAHFHRPLADARAVEPERPVEAEEAVGYEHSADGEVAARLPIAGDAQRQYHRVVAEGGDAVRFLPEARLIAGDELAVALVRHGREPGAAHGGRIGKAAFADPQFGAEDK